MPFCFMTGFYHNLSWSSFYVSTYYSSSFILAAMHYNIPCIPIIYLAILLMEEYVLNFNLLCNAILLTWSQKHYFTTHRKAIWMNGYILQYKCIRPHGGAVANRNTPQELIGQG